MPGKGKIGLCSQSRCWSQETEWHAAAGCAVCLCVCGPPCPSGSIKGRERLAAVLRHKPLRDCPPMSLPAPPHTLHFVPGTCGTNRSHRDTVAQGCRARLFLFRCLQIGCLGPVAIAVLNARSVTFDCAAPAPVQISSGLGGGAT